MGKTVKVSIIIPVYNAEPYLRECLESIQGQTLSEFEVICVDDGSTDDSLSILLEFTEKDHRFILLRQDHQFAGAARNLGIDHAAGEYLLFLDADDRFKPNMLAESAGKSDEDRAEICVFSSESFDHITNKTRLMSWTCAPTPRQKGIFSRQSDPDHIFSFTNTAPWNKLFRRDFVERNSLCFQSLSNANDLAFVCSALAFADRITTLDLPLVQYRTNNDCSVQGEQHKAPLSFYDALLELRSRLKTNGIYESLERAFLNTAADVTFYNLHRLRSTVPFEETYRFIKTTVLPELKLTNKPKDYYFIRPEMHIAERLQVIETESILDYYMKYTPDLPELEEYRLSHIVRKDSLKSMIRYVKQRLA